MPMAAIKAIIKNDFLKSNDYYCIKEIYRRLQMRKNGKGELDEIFDQRVCGTGGSIR